MPQGLRLIVSCEHASAVVPARWSDRFQGADDVLASHRGSDLGALSIAKRLARAFDVELLATRTTRLLADVNRSRGHRGLFSEFTRSLPEGERERILAHDWVPHRERVLAAVRSAHAHECVVVHVGVHSFTPVLNGRPRNVDIGLLYDPQRALERRVVGSWIARLRAVAPTWRVRRNAPYRGTSDGLTRTLRQLTVPATYAGIELEVNQAWSTTHVARGVCDRLKETLAATLLDLGREEA